MRLEYVVKRIGVFGLCIWAAASVNFVLPRLQPARRGAAGLDGGVWQAYVAYLADAVHLDFGYSSSAYPTRVNDLIAAALPGPWRCCSPPA